MINDFIERQIYKDLKKHLGKKEITVLIGSRQTGKTTLLKKLKKELEEKGKLVFYFNLDVVVDKQIVKNQTQFIRHLENVSGGKQCFVIIDEVQRLENPGLFLKGIFDLSLPFKLIVSGSSVLEIKSKVSESLTGRKRVFYLGTISFEEFVSFKKPNLDQLRPVKKVFEEEYLSLLGEYIRFGGYPQVILTKTEKEKIKVLEEIYSSYIEKDIKAFFQVRNETSFLTLVNLLAGQIGNLINKNLLSTNIGSNRTTVNNFLNYLEKSFIIKIIRPFFRNPKKELLKTPKVYFCDLGLRNLIIKNFNQFEGRPDKGELFENFVLLGIEPELDIVDKINHWRTKTKAEVDFIISRGRQTFPVEIKATRLIKPLYSKSFRSFIAAYKPEKGFLINLGLKAKTKLDSTEIEVLPFYQELF